MMAVKQDIATILKTYDELLNKNDITEAGKFLNEELSLAKEQNDFVTQMTLENELVSFYRIIGEQKSAVAAINEVLELLEKLDAKKTVIGANMYLNCATTLNFFKRTGDSLPLFERAFEAYINVLPENDYRFAGFFNNYALALYETENYPEALRFFRKALNILALFKGNSSEMALTFCNLSYLFYKTDDFEMLEKCLNSAFATLEDYDGEINSNFVLHSRKCIDAFKFFKKDEYIEKIERKLQ